MRNVGGGKFELHKDFLVSDPETDPGFDITKKIEKI